MTDVIGIFESPVEANRAIADLLSCGMVKGDISLIMSDKSRERFSAAAETTDDRVVKDAAIGATTGGVLTALLLGLTTASVIAVPGMALLVGGPLIAAIEGLGAGAAIGGLAGALAAIGVKSAEASKYEDAVKAGNAVVVAHTKNEKQEATAREVLQHTVVGYKAA